MKYCLILNGLRGSIIEFPRERNQVGFLMSLPRNYIGSSPSFVHLSVSFPLLRRPILVIIPLWVACWREAFHEFLMITVIGSFHSVSADIKSPKSFLLLSNCTPEILISKTSLLQTYWSRGWCVRRHPCKKLIIGNDYAVTRSSPESCWSLFAFVSEQTVELKWLTLNKHNKWFHSSRVKFPLEDVSKLVFGVDVQNLDLWVHIN